MDQLRAPLLMTAAMAAFAVEDAFIKFLVDSISAGQILLFVGLIGTLVFAAVAWSRGVQPVSRVALRGAVLWRNIGEMGGAGAMVLALAVAPLSVVTAILQTMPLAVTLAAALFLGEPVGWRRWSAIGVGFLGVLVVLRPGAEFEPGALLAVVAVLFLTMRDIVTRRVAPEVHSLQLSTWGFASVIVTGFLLLAITARPPVATSGLETLMIVGAAAAGMMGYVALVAATRIGQIATTTPFRYTRLVFAMLIGAVIFYERPDRYTVIGALMIVGAGLYSLAREMKRNRLPR